MKKNILTTISKLAFNTVLLSLVATSAFAHPQDTDSVLSIGVDTLLIFEKGLNIPATPQGHTGGQVVLGEAKRAADGQLRSYCVMTVPPSDHDRFIPIKTLARIVGVRSGLDFYDSSNWVTIDLNSSNSQGFQNQILCWSFDQGLSIGDFKNLISGTLSVRLPAPKHYNPFK